MTVEAWLLAATSVLAVVAVFAAVVALRAVRELKRERDLDSPPQAAVIEQAELVPAVRPIPPTATPALAREGELAPRLVEGRVIVPPTQHQVVMTALGRPGVRLSVVLYGLAYALRAENRDRINAMIRREYRQRRRERLRAGRQAMRAFRAGGGPRASGTDPHPIRKAS